MTLIVHDLNDEPPRFTQDRYEFTVNANRKPDADSIEVGSVFAVDLDQQDDGHLKFDKADDTASAAGFELVVGELGECGIQMPVDMLVDGKTYDLGVTVTDLSGHTAKTQVRVKVESRPLFDELAWSQEESYSSSIKENSPPGTQLIGVSADPVGLTANTKFIVGYKLTEPNDYFEIEENTGV